jgi:hypothetical protein
MYLADSDTPGLFVTQSALEIVRLEGKNVSLHIIASCSP